MSKSSKKLSPKDMPDNPKLSGEQNQFLRDVLERVRNTDPNAQPLINSVIQLILDYLPNHKSGSKHSFDEFEKTLFQNIYRSMGTYIDTKKAATSPESEKS